jgi:hypothetical protein
VHLAKVDQDLLTCIAHGVFLKVVQMVVMAVEVVISYSREARRCGHFYT